MPRVIVELHHLSLSLHARPAFACFNSAGHVRHAFLSLCTSWPVQHGHVSHSGHILPASSAVSVDDVVVDVYSTYSWSSAHTLTPLIPPSPCCCSSQAHWCSGHTHLDPFDPPPLDSILYGPEWDGSHLAKGPLLVSEDPQVCDSVAQLW